MQRGLLGHPVRMPSPPKDLEALFDKRRDEQRHGAPEAKPAGERPSWRDLDRKRDRGNHSQQARDPRDDAPPTDRHQAASAQKALKKDLEDLFKDKEREAWRPKVRAATDRAALDAVLDTMLAELGRLPSDAEILDRALETKKDTTLLAAVDTLTGCLSSFPENTRKVLVLKLQTRGKTSFDRAVKVAIDRLLAAQAG